MRILGGGGEPLVEVRDPGDRRQIGTSSDARSFEQWLRPEHGFPGAPGGESFESGTLRATALMSRIPPGRTLLVSHGYLLKIILATCVIGADPTLLRTFHLPNAEPIRLDRAEHSGQDLRARRWHWSGANT